MKYIIGNAKMNFTLDEIKPYLKGLKKIVKQTDNFVGVALPFPYLSCAQKYLKNYKKISYGAQNCHYKSSGAFTGEVGINMLKDFDCNLCIVGHSERRRYCNENDVEINLKLLELIKNGITPILCFGETLQEKQASKTKYVIKAQLTNALKNISDLSKIIFAYEPVWAIGTGLTPSTNEIKSICKYIKDLLAKIAGENQNIVLLYGGSMNEKNAEEILSLKEVDGGLIGGACLKLESFSKIINTKIKE